MASHCTCGSPLPAGASFCPNCGRPLAPGVGEPAVPPQEPAAEEPPAKNLRRSEAFLKASILPALCAIFLRVVLVAPNPLYVLLSYLIPAGAGYAAVRIFEKRYLSLPKISLGGALGLLTGMQCALAFLILNSMVILSQGKEVLLAPLRDHPEMSALAPQVAEALEDPGIFVAAVAIAFCIDAALVAGSAAAGGAVAVKLARTRLR